jgi:hypothetical protein
MTHAVIENAQVKTILIADLQAPPQAPERLMRGREILIGEEARTFFTLPATIEVFIDKSLGESEIAAYHLHLSELKLKGIAPNVYLIGSINYASGASLRFQSQTYIDIYKNLSDLLAPFQMSQAVDWMRSLESVSPELRPDALITLAGTMLATSSKWEFADRMALFFKETFGKAKIYRINEGRSQGLRFDVYTSEPIAKKLAMMGKGGTLPKSQVMNVAIYNSGSGNYRLEGPRMGNEIRTNIDGDAVNSAFGSYASAKSRDIKVFKQSVDQSNGLDDELKQVLKQAAEIISASELNSSEKEDAAESLVKIRDEMNRAAPDKRRIQRCLNWIRDLAPPAASVLASAIKIAELMKP